MNFTLIIGKIVRFPGIRGGLCRLAVFPKTGIMSMIPTGRGRTVWYTAPSPSGISNFKEYRTMDLLSIAILLFILMEPANVAILYFGRLRPTIQKLDAMGCITPKGYSKALGWQ